MPKVEIWKNDDATKKKLAKRLNNAKELRDKYEKQWEFNEKVLQNTRGSFQEGEFTSLSFESEAELAQFEGDNSLGVNYTFKNMRFIHSQLSTNPPTVIARPTSNDLDDRRKADTADRLIHYAIRQYKMQEKLDQCTLQCLYYGTSFIKIQYDPNAGENVIDYNEETGEVQMEGDITINIPSPWNIYLDPDANSWEDVKYVIEKMWIPWEEACFQFPEHKELLQKHRKTELATGSSQGMEESDSAIYGRKYDVVELYQYWEKGLPYNGMQGRFCWMTKNGEVLGNVEKNPHAFKPPRDEDEPDYPAIAEFPYHMITDIDIPNQVWGKATVDYEAPLQDTHNKMMNVMLDNLRAHGVARLILPEGAEIADDSITNSPWDIIKITGGHAQMPTFMQPMPFSGSFNDMLDRVKEGIDSSAGVNDAMFGDVKRETSGFSLQYATNQGNMIRRRFFNKYVFIVESVYKTFLNLVRKHWTTPKKVKVLGAEKAFNTTEIEGMDINGGYDLVVEYGNSLSLDPTMRREEILMMIPIFEKAGVESRTILSMLKLNELGGLYDVVKLAEDRQYEIFKEMTDTLEYIEPRDRQDHQNMLLFANQYVMTSEFKYLDPDAKLLIEQHISDREQLAAQTAQPEVPAVGAPTSPADLLGGMPMATVPTVPTE